MGSAWRCETATLLEGVMADLSSMLDKTATDHSEHPAIRQDDLVLTYAQLRESACRVASLLTSLGVTPGDRVGIMLPNVAAFPIAFYGALAAGCHRRADEPDAEEPRDRLLPRRFRAKVLLAWHEAAVEAAKGAAGTGAQVLEVDQPDLGALLTGITPASATADHAAEDDAVILYTSGTTGKPKGAELTHANLTRNAELAAATMLNAGPGDVTMGCLPLFHVFGLTCGLNATIAAGGTLTLLPRFDAARPRHHRARQGDDLRGRADDVRRDAAPPGRRAAPTPRRCAPASRVAPHAAGDPARIRADVRVHDPGSYGLSETSPRRVLQPPGPGTQARLDRHADRGDPDARGRTADEADVAAGEVGEIAIRGHNVMKGYWGKPDATARPSRTAGSAPETWPGSTTTAISSSSAARRT
jgi:long-chain acyl-CoA synthetase